MRKKYSSQKGVALLMSLGVLALLSILGAAFAINMRLLERTTRDFAYEVQARYLAEAGIEYAIATLKQDARNNFVYNGFNPSGTNKDEINLPTAQISLPTGNSITITAIDTARQININNANQTLLACIPNIGQNLASAIETTRSESMPEDKFLTKQSICLVPGIGAGTYNNIKDLITIDTYIDENTMTETETFKPRSAININSLVENTASETMLRKILDVVPGFGSGPDSSNVTKVVNSLKGNSSKPIESWGEFNDIIESTSIETATMNNIKNTFNPNRKKPSATYPTEFCFHSGGTYEINATGTITKGTGIQQQQVASKTITATAEIFNLWNQTTKEQFKGVVGNLPNYDRVTWFDSCPLDVTKCYTGYNYDKDNAETIPGSLKLGYWDDFNEDVEYSNSIWKNIGTGGTTSINGGSLNGSVGNWPLVGLGGLYNDPNRKWRWEYFSVRAKLDDIFEGELDQQKDHYKKQMDTVLYWSLYDYCSHLFVNSTTDVEGGTAQYDIILCRKDIKDTCPYKDNPDNHVSQYPDNFYLYLAGLRGPSISSYQPKKMFLVIRKKADATNDDVTIKTYYSSGYFTGEFSVGHNWKNRIGMVRVYAAMSGFILDNIRVIGMCSLAGNNQLPGAEEYGYYDFSPNPLNMPANYEWGTIFGTVTIPSTANGDSEKVSLFTRSAGTGSWNSIGTRGTSPDTGKGPGGSSVSGSIKPADSVNIDYRAHLTTNDDDFSETPVLEDVWITYLPKTKILYWKE